MKKSVLIGITIGAVVLYVLIMCIVVFSPQEAPDSDHTHRFSVWKTVQPPTCTQTGMKERTCDCGEKQTSPSSALGHSFSKYTIVSEPTCTELGVEEGTCSRCGEKDQKKTDYKHSFGDWVYEEENPCIYGGEKTRTCTLCGYVERGTAEKGHDYEIEQFDVTVSEDGYTLYICRKCKDTYKKNIEYATGSIGIEYERVSSGWRVVGIGTCTDEEIFIPQYHEGSKVVEIADRAFYDCDSIKEITIPDTVTKIGTQVFYKADNLHTVYYNSSYSSNRNPFLVTESIKTVIFGTKVPSSILSNATNVEHIEIKDAVKTIGSYAFSNCSNIQSIVLPDSITSIGDHAFEGCSSLESINIPRGVKEIGFSAFKSCSALKSIELPDTVTNIQAWTFQDCSSLESITISDSIVTIENSALRSSKELITINFSGTIEQWKNIPKEEYWNLGTGKYTVYCSDGTIARDGTVTYN